MDPVLRSGSGDRRFWVCKRPHPSQKPTGQGWGQALHRFQFVFCMASGRLDLQNRGSPTPDLTHKIQTTSLMITRANAGTNISIQPNKTPTKMYNSSLAKRTGTKCHTELPPHWTHKESRNNVHATAPDHEQAYRIHCKHKPAERAGSSMCNAILRCAVLQHR